MTGQAEMPRRMVIAQGLLDRIFERRFAFDGRSCWYRMTPDLRGYGQVAATDWSLYSGHGGILVAVSAMCEAFPEVCPFAQSLAQEFYREFAMQEIPEGDWPLGAYIGLSGHLYMSAHLAIRNVLPVGCCRDVATSALRRITSMVTDDTSYDLMEGSAGAILGILSAIDAGLLRPDQAQLAVTGLLSYLLEAARLGPVGVRGWIARDTGDVLGGMSHGYAGIAHAATCAMSISPDLAKKVARVAIEGQMSLYDHASNQFADLRPADPLIDTETEAWCHGSDGIVLAILASPDCWQMDPSLLTRILRSSIHGKVAPNYGLCHGIMGRIVVLNRIQDALSRGLYVAESDAIGDEVVRKMSRLVVNLLDSLESEQWSMDLEDPSLMTGISGVALGLVDADAASRVLTLAI